MPTRHPLFSQGKNKMAKKIGSFLKYWVDSIADARMRQAEHIIRTQQWIS